MSEADTQKKAKPVKAPPEEKKKKRGRPPKIELPLYFSDPALQDGTQLEAQKAEAFHWLLGTGPFEKTGKSYSAKITYLGPRRQHSRRLMVGNRIPNPTKGNWKIHTAPAIMWRGQEWSGNVKDTHFIFEALTTKGGKQNLKVRFVEDAPLDAGEVKKQFFKRDLGRFLAMPPHIRRDQIIQGIKCPLNPGEAVEILKQLSKEGAPKAAKGMVKYLNELISEEARLKKKDEKKKN